VRPGASLAWVDAERKLGIAFVLSARLTPMQLGEGWKPFG